MGFRFRTFNQATEKHPDTYIDIRDRKLDKDFPNFEEMPVSNYPALYIYNSKEDSEKDASGEEAIVIYWLREDW